jgi:spore germination cell wall hydrolase CwlJ-like protein
MFVSLRTAFMVIAALSGSSVAPAQVNPAAEPLIASGSDTLPEQFQPTVLTVEDAVKAVDPLAPMSEGDAAEEPQIEAGATLSEKVAQLRSSEPGSRELECLATGIYFESKSESLQGQLAVGHVIANRAESGRFPSSYCGVLFQRSQFSFIRGRSLPNVPRASQDWKDAVAIAKIVDQELHPSPMGKALFFHARRVSPGWRLTRVGTLGNHVFYR